MLRGGESGTDFIPLEVIRDAILFLDLLDRPVCVHASLRSFGHIVEGGPDGVLDTLLGAGCTVLTPMFSWTYSLPPPPELRPRRNGFNYARSDGQRMTTAIYTVDSNVIDEDMGAIAAAVVARQGRIRGNHALNSFTAVGPLAKHLIRDQAPLDVYAPLESLAAADGFVLLVGVGLEAMTLLHLAERRAGRNLFRRWARGPDGNPIMVEVGGCSRGFQRLERKLARLSREFHVGSSRWRVFPATTTLEAAERGIRATPSITRCDDPYCERCPDAIVGGPLL